MRQVAKRLACASLVLLFSTNVLAADYTKEETFKESPDKVLEAAERAARRIGGNIGSRPGSDPLTFQQQQDLVQGVSAFKGVFTCKRKPRTGKTIGRLRVAGVSWSQPSVYKGDSTAFARVISQRFFAALKEELGLCKHCTPPVRGSIMNPKVPPVNPRMP